MQSSDGSGARNDTETITQKVGLFSRYKDMLIAFFISLVTFYSPLVLAIGPWKAPQSQTDPLIHKTAVGERATKIQGLDPSAILQCQNCTCTFYKGDDSGIYIRTSSHCTFSDVLRIKSPEKNISTTIKKGTDFLEKKLNHKSPNSDLALFRILPETLKKNPKLAAIFKSVRPLPNCTDAELKEGMQLEKHSLYAIGNSDNFTGFIGNSRINRFADAGMQKWRPGGSKAQHGNIYVEYQVWNHRRDGICRGDSGGPLIYKPPNSNYYCILGNLAYINFREKKGYDLPESPLNSAGFCSSDGYYTKASESRMRELEADLFVAPNEGALQAGQEQRKKGKPPGRP